MKKILLLLLAVGIAFQIQAQDLMDGLVSVWELDEVSGTVFSDAHGIYNGSSLNTSVVPNQPGIINTACEFNENSTDRIELGPGLFFGQSAITISTWIKTDITDASYYRIVSSGESDNDIVSLRLNRHEVQFWTYNTNSDVDIARATINIGAWNHIVVTYDGSMVRLYLNGLLEDEGSQSGLLGEGTDQLSCIGNSSDRDRPNYAFEGLIDQTAVWHRALTSMEVYLLYNGGNGLSYSAWGDPAGGEPIELWLAEGDDIISGTTGNVGIGTSLPRGLLEISGPYNSKSQLIINTTQSNGELQFSDSGAVKGFVWFNKATDHMAFGRGSIDNSLFINPSGQISMGTTSVGTHRLAVEGTIGAREIVVETGTWSDFVFEPDYNLPTLKEVETYIDQNGHLPDIPSAEEVEEHGISLGEMDAMLLRKVEELTLYLIEQQKELKALKQENEDQAKEIHELESKLNSQ